MKSSHHTQDFLARTSSEKKHDRMSWLYVGMLTLTGLVAYGGYDYNQMDAIVTRPVVIEPASVAYDHAKAGLNNFGHWLVERTD